jgi:hypothetical protein
MLEGRGIRGIYAAEVKRKLPHQEVYTQCIKQHYYGAQCTE